MRSIKMKSTIVRQILIFSLYLIPISLVLIGNRGGTDIFFMLLMIIALSIHLLLVSIIVVINLGKQTKNINKFDIIIVIIISLIFFLFSSEYLWLISIVK